MWEKREKDEGTCVCVCEKFLTAEDPLLFHISPSVTNAWLYAAHIHAHTLTLKHTQTNT